MSQETCQNSLHILAVLYLKPDYLAEPDFLDTPEKLSGGLLNLAAYLSTLGGHRSQVKWLRAAAAMDRPIDALTALLKVAHSLEIPELAFEARRNLARLFAADTSVDALTQLELLGYILPKRLVADAGETSYDSLKLPDRRSLKIACIMDDFTVACFAPEAELRHLTPENWATELSDFSPDCLFVESVWRGKDAPWGNKVARKDQVIIDIVAWFRARQIPTLFWNKEDPIHYQTFIHTAQLFDHVFTTDIDCIVRYKEVLGHDRAWFLPFACQPRVHNPLEIFERKAAISFAGAYYVGDPDRVENLETFIAALPSILPVEIFDRNFGKTDVNYMFPRRYDPFIVGTLPPEHIDIAYKGYAYSINLNSVKQSQSMYARRVYELLASNTSTLSNYSYGLRLMFGDLVMSSDSVDELTKRFEQIVSRPDEGAKLRLAGLRKVMTEHTCEDRIRYIVDKVLPGQPQTEKMPRITVFSAPSTDAAVARVLQAYARQTCAHVRFIIVLPKTWTGPVPANVTALARAGAKTMSLEDIAQNGWFACFHEDDYYGPNYLTDLGLATRYSSPDVIGKSRTFRYSKEQVCLEGQDMPYTPVRSLSVRASMVRVACVGQLPVARLMGKTGIASWTDLNGLTIDPFNYCRNGGDQASVPNTVSETVDDMPGIRTGMSLLVMQEAAEHVSGVAQKRMEDIIPPAELLTFFPSRVAEASCLLGPDGLLEVSSTLDHDKHEYLTSAVRVPLARLTHDGVFKCFLDCSLGLSMKLALAFFDTNKKRISSIVVSANRNETVDIPAETHEVRFSLRVSGTGQAQIRGLVVGHRELPPHHLFSQSRVLVLTNKYPSYHSLYRNAFVHSRVRSYRQRNVPVDVFRLDDAEPLSAMEFENVDVVSGDGEALDQFLLDGRHDTVLVHFMRPEMWSILEKHLGRIRVIVWLHGAEIQPWWRRKFNYTTDQQLERAKEVTATTLAFWRNILNAGHGNLKLVFVSRYFADEVMEDLEVRLDSQTYDVIHNPIDTDIFAYKPKSPGDRLKILSIRPYVSPVYANDLSVEAVLLLSRKPFFDQLQFQFYGDGALFDDILEPLHKFPNVFIQRGYLTHDEIARLHRQNGIFLVPTRGDTQGVSRDEAMASGLVPVTNAVGAVPEFADETCAILAPEEDAVELAAGIERLYEDPDLFLRMSAAAAARVRRQSANAIIIDKEVALFATPHPATTGGPPCQAR